MTMRSPEALPNKNGSERQTSTDAKPEPKEPTNSQSFDAELEEALCQLGTKTAKVVSSGYVPPDTAERHIKEAKSAIKATVEKHYQIKEEE